MLRIISLVVILIISSCYSQDEISTAVNTIISSASQPQSCSNQEPVDSSRITFTLYTRNQRNGVLVTGQNYSGNPNDPTIFIIHSFLRDGRRPWVFQMIDLYFQNEAANMIVVDWSPYATDPSSTDVIIRSINSYQRAYCATPAVGRTVGDFICQLVSANNIQLSTTQLIGIGFGGQIAGYAGQQVQQQCNGNIGKIVGLEAIGPRYTDAPVSERLDSSDAIVVVGIHTNNFQFGFPYNYGTIDFHANCLPSPDNSTLVCGSIQPGCPEDAGFPVTGSNSQPNLESMITCNHIRSLAYYLEGIRSNNFIAVPCTCSDFGLNRCENRSGVVMGDGTPNDATGVYYLNTNCRAPFALGENGKGGISINNCNSGRGGRSL